MKPKGSDPFTASIWSDYQHVSVWLRHSKRVLLRHTNSVYLPTLRKSGRLTDSAVCDVPLS